MEDIDYYENGIEAIRNKDYKEAQRCLRKSLFYNERNPYETKFHLAFSLEMQGIRAASKGHFDEALSLYNDASSSDAPIEISGNALFRSGCIYMNNYDYNNALRYYDLAIEKLKGSKTQTHIYNECLNLKKSCLEKIELNESFQGYAGAAVFPEQGNHIGLPLQRHLLMDKTFYQKVSQKASPHNYKFILLYVKNMMIIRYRGAYLGFIWNIIQPMLYLLILGFVFAEFNNAPIHQYVMYLFAGLIPWRFLEQGVMSMTDSILINRHITQAIKMPYIYFPLTQLGIAFIDFLFSFLALIIVFLIFNAEWHIQILILPLSVLIFSIIIAGAGIITATLFVFFQDIKSLIQMGLMLLLFSSTIFFKIEIFSGHPYKLMFLRYDPVCYWMRLFQKPIYYGQMPSFMDWTVSIISGIILLSIGLLIYNKTKRHFYYYM